MIELYNSLTKKLELFKPLKENEVSIYSCGPTVYDSLHIGNLSAFIYADMLRRMFVASGYTATHVMNITDIDDKTIRNSKEEFADKSPGEALTALTDKYASVFKQDITSVAIDAAAITFISAVETIPEMIALTQKLLDNDIAYIADDGVYFSITKYYQAGHTYGVLQKIATQQSKARIANDEYDKDSASDFALWKRGADNEPQWEATFSEDTIETHMPGRPGWHIECSAMSEKVLGLPFDIHTGGIDLKFPHHENEIAQSTAAGASEFAHLFFHNNHLLVEGKKMSKSLKNFYTLRDLEDKDFSLSAFRLLILESHYHSENNFSWEILQAAQNRLLNWQSVADRRWQIKKTVDNGLSTELLGVLQKNLDTPAALKTIDEYFAECVNKDRAPDEDSLISIRDILGVDVLLPDIEDDLKKILTERAKARELSDWATSDLLRDSLVQHGIRVRDDKNHQLWSRIEL